MSEGERITARGFEDGTPVPEELRPHVAAGIQRALELLLKGDTEGAVETIKWSETRLGRYTEPTEPQKEHITPQDGRLAKKALAHLFDAGVKLLAPKHRGAAAKSAPRRRSSRPVRRAATRE